jgi:sigma-B regulation protein RsbU (phosphoserine phosphatase)
LFEDDRNEDLEDLYENAPCGYLSLRPNGRIAKVNRTLCKWIGRTPEDILGKRLRDLLNVAGGIFYETHFAPLLRMQGFFDEVALDLVKSDGTVLPVLANAAERRDDAGNVLFTRLTIIRATERRRYERQLVEAQEAAREAQRRLESINAELSAERMAEKETAELREQFIAVLGHDLRNPLAGLGGGTNILSQMHHDPKSIRILRLMGESINRMGGLIDNLMDFARGRLGGGIGIQRTTGDRIEPTLAQVVNELQTGHPDRQIEMRFDLPHPIDVDHARIAQMFSNLLGNAISHGAEDRPIVVEATVADGHFQLAVANAGEPISQAAMDRLFQPFYRGEVRPSMQGLGLGLYIASQIAEAHGGRIDVKSDAEETRFIFRMPLEPPQPPESSGR